MQFKLIAIFLSLVSFNCIGQEVKSIKTEDKMSTVEGEPFGLIKQRKPTGDFIPGFNEEKDLLIVKINHEEYTIKPNDLVPLIFDANWMSSIPQWNANISYYKDGKAVYTNAQYVLNIDTKKIDPKIFKKLKHHKEIIKAEEIYLARRKAEEKINESDQNENKYYFIEHQTNNYRLYFNVYVSLTLAEQHALTDRLSGYHPTDYYKAGGKDKMENDIKSRTVEYNHCEYYFTAADDDHDLAGYNTSSEDIFLVPIKVYCKSAIDDCRNKFDLKTMELLYGKPINFFKEKAQKNEAYILDWFEYK